MLLVVVLSVFVLSVMGHGVPRLVVSDSRKLSCWPPYHLDDRIALTELIYSNEHGSLIEGFPHCQQHH